MSVEYIVQHNIQDCRFQVELGNENAILIYMIKAGLFIILHTEVPPSFEGKGIASKLAYNAFEFAKNSGYKIRSYCAFTTRYMQRHPEYKEFEG